MNTLEIEWRHFDQAGNTCVRCSDTGNNLKDVVAQLTEECKPAGWKILFKETKLTEAELPESNIILFNGIPIEAILPQARASESHCVSCCEMVGTSETCCRTVEYEGQSYEEIPVSLIRQAACQIAQCC